MKDPKRALEQPQAQTQAVDFVESPGAVLERLRHAIHNDTPLIRGRRVVDAGCFFDALDDQKRYALDRGTLAQGIMLLNLKLTRAEIGKFVASMTNPTGLVERADFVDMVEERSTCASEKEDQYGQSSSMKKEPFGHRRRQKCQKKPFVPAGRHLVMEPRALPRVPSTAGSSAIKCLLPVAAPQRDELPEAVVEAELQPSNARVLFESLLRERPQPQKHLGPPELRRFVELCGRGASGQALPSDQQVDLLAFQLALADPTSSMYCSETELESVLTEIGPRSWLVRHLFRLLADDEEYTDGGRCLRRYAELCGFKSTDDEWASELEEIGSAYAWEPSTRMDVALFERMINDTDGVAWLDDSKLRELCQRLRHPDKDETDEQRRDAALLRVFQRLDSARCQRLGVYTLRPWAEYCGFEGSDDEWHRAYGQLSAQGSFEPEIGVSLDDFKRLVSDQDNHLHGDDEDLRFFLEDDSEPQPSNAQILFESLLNDENQKRLGAPELRRFAELRGHRASDQVFPAGRELDMPAFELALADPASSMHCTSAKMESLLTAIGPRDWLVRHLFRMLAEGAERLEADVGLRWYADLCGFEGDDDGWASQLSEIGAAYAWDPATGVDWTLFERMLSDTEGLAWQDDPTLREICRDLGERLAKQAE